MAAPACTLGGLNLQSGAYGIVAPFDTGSNDLMATLTVGDLKMEEYDQYLTEIRYTRQVNVGLTIRSASLAATVTDAQAIIQKLTPANRFSTIDFVFTPSGGNASTFKVIGGALETLYTQKQDTVWIQDCVLHLDCLPWVYGAAQNLGSSGAPLTTNAASPANATLAPSPTGDVPGDVILFVKNRSASPIRSLIAGGISSNTTWTAGVDQSTWTLDSGARSGGAVYSAAITTPTGVAHFTAPTLPSDRRFRIYLRAGQYLHDGGGVLFRVRLTSGQAEVIGGWRSLPPETNQSTYLPMNGVDMGAFTFPVSDVGALGAQSTTVYIEAMQNVPVVSANKANFAEALFMPDDSTIIVETSDTGKTLAAAAATVRVESDQVYDSSGNPAGGVMTGAHIRTLGGRYVVYASQYYLGTIDNTVNGWAPENVDIYATFTPRYIHLA